MDKKYTYHMDPEEEDINKHLWIDEWILCNNCIPTPTFHIKTASPNTLNLLGWQGETKKTLEWLTR